MGQVGENGAMKIAGGEAPLHCTDLANLARQSSNDICSSAEPGRNLADSFVPCHASHCGHIKVKGLKFQ